MNKNILKNKLLSTIALSSFILSADGAFANPAWNKIKNANNVPVLKEMSYGGEAYNFLYKKLGLDSGTLFIRDDGMDLSFGEKYKVHVLNSASKSSIKVTQRDKTANSKSGGDTYLEFEHNNTQGMDLIAEEVQSVVDAISQEGTFIPFTIDSYLNQGHALLVVMMKDKADQKIKAIYFDSQGGKGSNSFSEIEKYLNWAGVETVIDAKITTQGNDGSCTQHVVEAVRVLQDAYNKGILKNVNQHMVHNVLSNNFGHIDKVQASQLAMLWEAYAADNTNKAAKDVISIPKEISNLFEKLKTDGNLDGKKTVTEKEMEAALDLVAGVTVKNNSVTAPQSVTMVQNVAKSPEVQAALATVVEANKAEVKVAEAKVQEAQSSLQALDVEVQEVKSAKVELEKQKEAVAKSDVAKVAELQAEIEKVQAQEVQLEKAKLAAAAMVQEKADKKQVLAAIQDLEVQFVQNMSGVDTDTDGSAAEVNLEQVMSSIQNETVLVKAIKDAVNNDKTTSESAKNFQAKLAFMQDQRVKQNEEEVKKNLKKAAQYETENFKALIDIIKEMQTNTPENSKPIEEFLTVLITEDVKKIKDIKDASSFVFEDKESTNAILEMASMSSSSLSSRMIAVGVGAGDENTALNYGLWTQGNFTSAKQKGYGLVSGYDLKQSGGVVGFDIGMDDFLIGTSYAMAKHNIKGKNFDRKDNIVSHLGSLYGSYNVTPAIFVQGQVFYGINSIKKERNTGDLAGNKASAKTKGRTYGGQAKIGYDYLIAGTGFEVIPTVGFAYNNVAINGYTEKGAGLNKLKTSKTSANKSSVIGGMMLRHSTKLDAVNLVTEIHADLDHTLSSKNSKTKVELVKGVEFTTPNAKFAKQSFVYGGSVGVVANNGIEAKVGYDLGISKKFQSHTGYVNLRINF